MVNLQDLPEELIFFCLFPLLTPRQLCRISRVCKRLHTLGNDVRGAIVCLICWQNLAWRLRAQTTFPNIEKPTNKDTGGDLCWKKEFLDRSLTKTVGEKPPMAMRMLTHSSVFFPTALNPGSRSVIVTFFICNNESHNFIKSKALASFPSLNPEDFVLLNKVDEVPSVFCHVLPQFLFSIQPTKGDDQNYKALRTSWFRKKKYRLPETPCKIVLQSLLSLISKCILFLCRVFHLFRNHSISDFCQIESLRRCWPWSSASCLCFEDFVHIKQRKLATSYIHQSPHHIAHLSKVLTTVGRQWIPVGTGILLILQSLQSILREEICAVWEVGVLFGLRTLPGIFAPDCST